MLLLVMSCTGLLVASKRTADRELAAFFEEVERSSLTELESSLHEEMRSQPSPERAAAFLKEIPARFGRFESMAPLGFEVNTQLVNGRQETEYDGTLRFEHGEFAMRLTFFDEQLAGFEVQDESVAAQLLEALSRVPIECGRYRERAERFLELLFEGRSDEAWSLLSPHLQEQMKRQDLDDLAVGFASWGEFRGIRYETEAVDAEDPAVLHLHYVCTFGDRNYLFEVSFGFAGLEVHLFAFRWDLVKLAP